MNKLSYSNIVLFLIFLSLIFSFYIGEDSTGGAKNDYLHHENITLLFVDNFKDTFFKYGTPEVMARNSPVFYIIVSFFVKLGLSLKIVNYLHAIVIPLYILIFISCLKVKYKFLTINEQLLFSSIIFLSPTIRSLVVWPYPFIWGLLFFLVSIYFFLKFQNVKNIKTKFSYSLCNIFFLSLSAYFTPNFAIFAIFYFFKFFDVFKISKNLIFIILLNLILALPAIFYYIKTDFYLFKFTVEAIDVFTKYNFANKIIIITSIVFFYFIPFLEFGNIKKINFKKFIYNKSYYLIIALCIPIIILFDFPSNLRFGGGIFFHLSNKILSNSLILFFIFILSMIIFKFSGIINKKNTILFFCLIFYNIQASIYHKYFDPLIYFMILFLFEFAENKGIKINIKLFSKILIFYSFFLILSLYKKFIVY